MPDAHMVVELLSVIGGHHDDGVVQEPALLELREQLLDGGVDGPHLGVIDVLERRDRGKVVAREAGQRAEPLGRRDIEEAVGRRARGFRPAAGLQQLVEKSPRRILRKVRFHVLHVEEERRIPGSARRPRQGRGCSRGGHAPWLASAGAGAAPTSSGRSPGRSRSPQRRPDWPRTPPSPSRGRAAPRTATPHRAPAPRRSRLRRAGAGSARSGVTPPTAGSRAPGRRRE